MCRCAGVGLRNKPGVAKGQLCEQDEALSATVETTSVLVVVRKPGVLQSPFGLTTAVFGDSPMQISMRAKVEWVDSRQRRFFRENIVLGSDITGFGLEIRWLSGETPPAVWDVNLDANMFKYVDSLRSSFTVGVLCSTEGECPADGDRLSAVIDIESSRHMNTTVSIEVIVEALASCDRSQAAIRYSEDSTAELMPASEITVSAERLQVDFWAIDVDGLPIQNSAPAMMVRWYSGERGVLAELQLLTAEHSNQFTVAVPVQLRSTTGLFRVRMELLEGWNSTLGTAGTCVLLDQAVSVVEAGSGSPMVWVLTGAIAGSLVILASIFFAIRRTSSNINLVLMMLATEVSMIVFVIIGEMVDVITDGMAFAQVLGSKLDLPIKTAYTIFIAMSCCMAVTNICYRIRNARLIRQHLKTLAEQTRTGDDSDGGLQRRKSAAHLKLQGEADSFEWELSKNSRLLFSCYLNILKMALGGLCTYLRGGHSYLALRCCCSCSIDWLEHCLDVRLQRISSLCAPSPF
jgi:hypothetical protein